MDRIDSLLQTLLTQRASQASADALLNTISLLQFELQKEQPHANQELGTSKVSVLLPTGNLSMPASTPIIANEIASSSAPSTAKEVNEVVVAEPTLNDRLRDEKPMLAATLQEGPIKDLRKGISLNERYQLVKELFDGDESRFDKAIKTINGFSILAEAQFWIDKELRLKPGWPSGSPSALLLDQLVKRRFS